MSRHPLNARLRVEELETRATPAALSAAEAPTAPTFIKEDGAVLAHNEPTPMHVSLVAVAVVGLCAGWDRRTREGRARLIR